MRIATVDHRGSIFPVSVDLGTQTARRVAPLGGAAFETTQSVIEMAGADAVPIGAVGQAIPLSEVRIQAPLPRPRRNILCVGKNYREHAAEFTRSGFDSSASSMADAVPSAPIVFTKFPETVIGPDCPVRYPTGASLQLDYEAELGVIIGRGGRDIARVDALDHVFGFTIINDVTARDRQARHKQWFLGKSLDTFCPMGPFIVTRDEFNLQTARVHCWVNGELRQDACTADLIFDVPSLIEVLSQGLTLLPGDVIATGTPAGVGIGFTPPRYLVQGDVIEIEISGLGRLRNSIA